MSDSDSGAGHDGDNLNEAQREFQRYKARMGAMGGMPGAMPGPMVLPWAAPAWAMPPSFAPMQPPPGVGLPPPAQPGQAAGAVAGRLGETFRLGVDVLNAALANTLTAIGGFTAAAPGWGYGYGYGHHPHSYRDCGCSSCCEAMSCCCDSCCSPNVCGCC